MNVFVLIGRAWTRLRQLEYRLLALATVAHILLFFAVLKATEKPDASILDPINYWYYWATTVLTIGYGDLSPQSALGRLFAPFFEASGILLLTAWLTKAGSLLVEHASRKRKGLMPTHHTKHVLIIGDYDAMSTERLLESALLDIIDDDQEAFAVGCFRNCGEQNPFLEAVAGVRPDYVQAAGGFSAKILENAGASAAASIFVACVDDMTAIGIVCTLSRLKVKAPVALILRQDESVDSVPQTELDLRIITPMEGILAVREMNDPGTGAVIRELATTGRSTSIHSLRLDIGPGKRVRFIDAGNAFMRQFGAEALLLGFVRREGSLETPFLMPKVGTEIRDGDTLIYIADKDLTAPQERSYTERMRAIVRQKEPAVA